MPDPETLKRCAQSQQSRPIGEFLVSKYTTDGLTGTCKPCIFARAAEYRAASEARDARRTNHAGRLLRRRQESTQAPGGLTWHSSHR